MTAAQGPKPARAHLVIADHRPRARRALRALLATHPGFEVIGEEALASVERLAPDVVILDVRLPRLDGIAAAARIKTRWPGVRVVAHSLAVDYRAAAPAAAPTSSSQGPNTGGAVGRWSAIKV
jgi:DNA-binding NarL/FixJ family response regulator